MRLHGVINTTSAKQELNSADRIHLLNAIKDKISNFNQIKKQKKRAVKFKMTDIKMHSGSFSIS